ncbi:MAG: hypothetical protein SFZ23_10650 [Planctomycetota bacterium]|nr:hypothetical protein [Planctomycetota bacterium]
MNEVLYGVLIAVGLVAAASLIAGLVGRRVARTPECRECGFSLEGLVLAGVPASAAKPGTSLQLSEEPSGELAPHTSPVNPAVRCPECGGSLVGRGAIRVSGRRRSRPRVARASVVLMLVVGILLADRHAKTQPGGWYTFVPSWVLVRVVPLPTLDVQNLAGKELALRLQGGAPGRPRTLLAEKHRVKLVERLTAQMPLGASPTRESIRKANIEAFTRVLRPESSPALTGPVWEAMLATEPDAFDNSSLDETFQVVNRYADYSHHHKEVRRWFLDRLDSIGSVASLYRCAASSELLRVVVRSQDDAIRVARAFLQPSVRQSFMSSAPGDEIEFQIDWGPVSDCLDPRNPRELPFWILSSQAWFGSGGFGSGGFGGRETVPPAEGLHATPLFMNAFGIYEGPSRDTLFRVAAPLTDGDHVINLLVVLTVPVGDHSVTLDFPLALEAQVVEAQPPTRTVDLAADADAFLCGPITISPRVAREGDRPWPEASVVRVQDLIAQRLRHTRDVAVALRDADHPERSWEIMRFMWMPTDYTDLAELNRRSFESVVTPSIPRDVSRVEVLVTPLDQGVPAGKAVSAGVVDLTHGDPVIVPPETPTIKE